MPSKTPTENGTYLKVEKYKSSNMPCSVYMAPTKGVCLNNNLKSSARAIKVNISQTISNPMVSPNVKRPKQNKSALESVVNATSKKTTTSVAIS